MFVLKYVRVLRGDLLQTGVSGAQNQSDYRKYALPNNKIAACFFRKFEVGHNTLNFGNFWIKNDFISSIQLGYFPATKFCRNRSFPSAAIIVLPACCTMSVFLTIEQCHAHAR